MRPWRRDGVAAHAARTGRRALAALALVAAFATRAEDRPFTVVEATIPELQAAMRDGRTTARAIVAQYLARIAAHDATLHATLAVNPNALADADALDRERAAGSVRGPLHGVPIAVKDNIQTADMPTTGGARALAGFVPAHDAALVEKLRAAGAIVVAKTAMTELANFMALGMPGNYNAIAGHGLNPYDPRPDPRDDANGRAVLSPGGSSSGAGTAASLWAASVGTETSGSILDPANRTMLVGIKPTLGRVSRYGIVPIVLDQDTAGPMARTVTDAALVLGAIEGGDARDSAHGGFRCERPAHGDYTPFLRIDGLRGARIGIPRAVFYEPLALAGAEQPIGGLEPAQRRAMRRAIRALRRAGATIVDPADLPSVVARDVDRNVLVWDICVQRTSVAATRCSTVLGYGMKRDFERWLAEVGAPVRSLAELRRWNTANAGAALRYGQALLAFSDGFDLVRDAPRYAADRARDVRLSRAEGIDAALRAHRLDALLFPGAEGSDIAARAGYPSVIVPYASVPNAVHPPLPDGFDPRPVPFGVTFTGTACSEPTLLRIAYAFEQATRGRVAPRGFEAP